MYLSYNVIAVVNYVHDVKWTRISANHIQFNCTLACRSAIKYCVVELNTTKNMSVVINKEALSSWAIVDFFIPDTHQSFTYTAFAEDSSENVLGQRINGNVPSVVSVVYSILMPLTVMCVINIGGFNRCTKYHRPNEQV